MSDRQILRLLASVEKRDDGCWLWTGPVDRDGYGKTKTGGRTVGTHRLAYALFREPPPAGIPLDHLCHTRACNLGALCPHRRCCNPEHLAVSTVKDNTRRGNAGRNSWARYRRTGLCGNGHPWIPENIVSRAHAPHVCILCERARNLRTKARRRARAATGV